VRTTPAGDGAVLDARHGRAAGIAELLAACDAADLAAVEHAVGALERALLATTPDGRRPSHPAGAGVQEG
jgi:hypothetical protein